MIQYMNSVMLCCVVAITLQDPHTCSRCHSAATCAAVHAVVEGGSSSSSSGMDESQWTGLAGAVSAAAAEWGRKWLKCIDWEEAAGRARRAEMWALTGGWRCWCDCFGFYSVSEVIRPRLFLYRYLQVGGDADVIVYSTILVN